MISGTYDLIADPSWSLSQLQEIYLECDTSINPVTINLFTISDLLGFKNVKIYVSDIGNNANVNNITINTTGGNYINITTQTNFLITNNGGCCIFSIMTDDQWSALTQTIIVQTGLTYKGTWNADTNTPTLTSGVGTNGDYYIVSFPGTTNLDGVTDWQVGDWAIFETVWQKIDNHDVQAYNTIQEEGASLPQRSIIDFQGTGVTATDNGVKTIVTIPTPPTPQAYSTIQEEGFALPQRSIIDFQGTGVTATDNGVKTIVTIPGISTSNYGLFTQTTQGAIISNTLVESSLIGTGLGTLTVPQNTFSVGDSFHAIMTGHLSSLNNQGLRVRIKANNVLLADTGLLTLNTTTNRHFKLEVFFTIRTTGVSGIASIVSGGTFMYTKNASVSFEGADFSTETTTGFDTTIDNTLVITAQWSQTNLANKIYSEILTLTKTY